MSEWIGKVGGRKFLLGLIYLTLAFILGMFGIIYGRDLVGISALIASMASGLGVVVWGNVAAGKGTNGTTQ